MTRDLRRPPATGAALALAAALLFGAGTPLAKRLLEETGPWTLAGLLYLGSGVGLAVWIGLRRLGGRAAEEAPLRGRDWVTLAAAIVAGGVVAPVLLLHGLAHATASAISLLLNLEGVLTVALAWLVFREPLSGRVAAGMASIAVGGVVLAISEGDDVSASGGALAVVAACLLWALDNNLTRKVSGADPVVVAMTKGLSAGAVNASIGLVAGDTWPAPTAVALGALLGLASYGASLVLYVLALRRIGAARTGACFSVAPFAGATLAVTAFGESLGAGLAIAGALMAIGVWLHLTERHSHEHTHEAITHEHRHVHDEHHQHEHSPGDPPGEPHSHLHRHPALRHEHLHHPDLHHRHPH